MKAVYVVMAATATGVGAILSANYLHFSNKLSQLFVTDSLYILAGVFLVLACILIIAGIRRKRSDKGFMTIRQYYQYRSAR